MLNCFCRKLFYNKQGPSIFTLESDICDEDYSFEDSNILDIDLIIDRLFYGDSLIDIRCYPKLIDTPLTSIFL